jgi:hypothetical protein
MTPDPPKDVGAGVELANLVRDRRRAKRPPRPRRDPAAPLDAELRRLQRHGLGVALVRVVWAPQALGKLGEVQADTVFVYVADVESAVAVVRHEVIHHEIAACQAPLLNLLNAVLGAVNREAYQAAEALTNRIAAALAE